MHNETNIKFSYKKLASALCVLLPLGFGIYAYSAEAQQSEQEGGSIRIIDLSRGGMGTQRPAPQPSSTGDDSTTIRIIQSPRQPPQQGATAASSSPDSGVQVRSATHDRYDRLVFDWPQNVTYSSKTEGRIFTITFDKNATVDMARIVRNMPLVTVVHSVQSSPLSVSVEMKDNVIPDTFRIGNRVIIDFKKDVVPSKFLDAARRVTPEKLEADTRQTAQRAQDASPPTTARAQREQAASRVPVEAVSVERVGTIETPPVSELLRKSEQGEAKSTARFRAVEKAAQELKADRTAKLSEGDVISVSSLRPLGLAAFVKAGHLWIVQSELRQGVPPVLRQSKPVSPLSIRDQDAKAEAWLFPIEDNLVPRVKMVDFAWEISIQSRLDDSVSVPVITEKSDYRGRNQDVVRVKLNQDVEPLKLTDPIVGDEIFVIPVFKDSLRVFRTVNLPKFRFIPASLGVAVYPLSDSLDVFAEDRDVFIADVTGLNISSPDKQVGQRFSGVEPQKINRLFDFEQWKSPSKENFQTERRNLERSISFIKDEQERLPKMLDLAKLYFANGMPLEATGILRLVKQQSDTIKNNPNYLALEGIIFSLADRHEEALENFKNPLIANETEIALWRGYSLANLGLWKEAYDNFAKTSNLIIDYPEPIRSKMLIVLAETAVSVFDTMNAQSLVNLLEEKPRKTAREESALRYLKGRIAQLNRDDKTAERYFRAESTSVDRYFRAKSALELLKLRMRTGSIENQQAIEVLERLRYVWRNDNFEIEILERLGEAYIGMDDYRRGLMTLRGIVPLVENDQARTDEITEKLTRHFRKLFVDGEAANMPPLTALALYNEFSELTPVGKEGDIAIQKLAERMVEMDLLDRASKLLEHQIKFRLKGDDAVRVGNRLAAIRLLDNSPESALAALDVIKDQEAAQEFHEERKLLRARAYSQMNQPDKALEILSGLNSEMAHRLNVDVNWKAGRWDKAAKAIDPLLSYVLKQDDLIDEDGKVHSLNEDSANLILNQAVAYTLAGQLGHVRKLADNFGEAMAKTPNAALFQLVTRAPRPGQLADLQTLQSHVGEVDLFKGFLDAYKDKLGEPL